MALTLLKSPAKVAPVFLPVEYEFLYTQQLSSPSAFLPGAPTKNIGGFLAVRALPTQLPPGTRFYLAKQSSPNLYQPKPVNVTETKREFDFGPPISIRFFAVTDIPFNESLNAVDCYTLDYIRNLQPQFHLYVNGNYLAPVAPLRQPNGQLVVRLNAYLQSCFEGAEAPPFVGINPQIKKSYQLRYSEGSGTQEDFEKHVIFSCEPIGIPECAEAKDVISWQAEGESCERDSFGANTGNRVYSTLRKYVNGVSTGETKPNAPDDPFYRAPVADPNGCQVPSREIMFRIDRVLENGIGKVTIYDFTGGHPADGPYLYSLDNVTFSPVDTLPQPSSGVYTLTGFAPGQEVAVYGRRGDGPVWTMIVGIPEAEPNYKTILTAYQSGGVGQVVFERYFAGAEVLTLWYEVQQKAYGASEWNLLGTSTISIPAGQEEYENAIPITLSGGGQYRVKPIKIQPAIYNLPDEDFL